MKISIVAAMAKNRVIGAQNRLPWDIPEDLRYFRALTQGHPVIMGRKTYQSIGRLLPKRLNILVSRDPAYAVAGAVTVTSIEAAIAEARKAEGDEAFVIGGSEIYALALPLAQRVYLTLIEREYPGDAFFPPLPEGPGGWKEVSRDRRRGDPDFSFVVYEKA